jgi:hypothetical protein
MLSSAEWKSLLELCDKFPVLQQPVRRSSKSTCFDIAKLEYVTVKRRLMMANCQ